MGAGVRSVSTARNADGRLEVFAVNIDDTLSTDTQTFAPPPGRHWTGFVRWS